MFNVAARVTPVAHLGRDLISRAIYNRWSMYVILYVKFIVIFVIRLSSIELDFTLAKH